MLKFLVFSLCMISFAEAAIICKGQTNHGVGIEVTYESDIRGVKVISNDSTNMTVFSDVHDVWDGHMTGLVTAPGFSMKYENQYGCIRNVTVTTLTRSPNGGFAVANFKLCKGESGHDSACGRH